MDTPATLPARPLAALWSRYRRYRRRFVLAVAVSSVNKLADIVPELLIGAAVDVVVRGADSFVAGMLGVESRYTQLVWLAVINAVAFATSVSSNCSCRPFVHYNCCGAR